MSTGQHIPLAIRRKVKLRTYWCRSRGTGFADCPLVGPHPTRQGPTLVTSKRYQRHEAEATPLYKIVAEHFETFVAEARETHERALPPYVERELNSASEKWLRHQLDTISC